MVSQRLIGRFGLHWGKATVLVASLVCCLLAFGIPLRAQVQTGRILGSVTDQTGGSVMGATVTVTNTETGVSRSLVSDSAGEYAAPNLNPGKYTVRVTNAGFQAFELKDIDLTTGKELRVDAKLVPGQITQTVTVQENVLQLDTSTSTVTGTIESAAVADLPINGRNYQNLLNLRPGVFMRPGGGTLVTNTNGLRAEENNYYVEGLDVMEPFTGQSIMNSSLPSGDAATFIPVDAIREVTIETNAPAEFGKKPGAVIDAGIKGGTNTLHGSAYAFGRSDKLNAVDYLTTKQPADLEQWGGTLGGKIVKDKLFYFGGFERQTYTVGTSIPFVTPSTNPANTAVDQSIPAAEADLTNFCAGAAGAGKSFCSGPGHSYVRNVVSNQILPLWSATSGISTNQNGGFPEVIGVYNLIGKVDYHLNDRNSISGSYFFGNGHSLSEDSTFVQPFFRTVGLLKAQFVTTAWTYTPNSSWVNDLRFGFNWHHRSAVPQDSTTSTSLSQTYGINTGVSGPQLQGFPSVAFSGAVGQGFTSIGGDPNEPKNYGPTHNYDIVDHASYLLGKHALKFGGEILFSQPYYGNFTNGRGSINFAGGGAFSGAAGLGVKGSSSNLEDFLAGVPDPSANSVVLNGDPTRTLSHQVYSLFIEDSWHALKTVTVNAGIRYEYFTPLKESHNLIGGWDPTVGLQQVGVNENSPYAAYKKDFSPRVGVAWDIGGKGKTVLRAGGGIFYADPVIGALVDNISLPGKPSGIGSVPTAYFTGTDGTAAPLLAGSSGGIATAFLNFTGPQLNWSTLAGPIYPANAVGAAAVGRCGDGLTVAGVKHPSQCSILVAGPTFRPPRVEIWSVGIQRTLTKNMSLEVNYVGNHSGNLIAALDVNAWDPTSAAEIACGQCEIPQNRPFYAKYPYLQFINVLQNVDRTNYNALQSQFVVRGFHGLGFNASYAWAHALDDNSSTRNQQVPMNNLNPDQDYGPAGSDHRHHFSISGNYALPGKKGFGQLLEGWKVNAALLAMTGTPWTASAASLDISKTGDKKADRWDFFGDPNDFRAQKNTAIPFYVGGAANMPAACIADATAVGALANLATRGCYAVGNSVLIAPPTGTFGTAARGLFRNFGFFNTDMSLFKDTVIKERLTAQFRVEFFNIFNRPNLAGAGTNVSNSGTFGNANSTPDQAGQNAVIGTGGARVIQLGLKLLF